MAQVTWTCNKDSRVANNGSNLGAGTSSFNPVGVYSGYTYFTLLDFPENFAGMISITSAILHLRTSTQSYVAFGSDPDIYVHRLTSAFSEGSSSSMSTSNAVVYPGPGVANQSGPYDISTAESTWVTCDITGILQAAMAAGVFYGLRLQAASTASSDVTEFYSREGGSAPYIVITYTTNTVPNAPTQNSPANGAFLTGGQPILQFTPNDPQGDAANAFHYQIALDAGFTAMYEDVTVGGSWANGSLISYSMQNPANRGTTYYWRVQTSDAISGYGGWSGTWSFRLNQLPTVSFVHPSAADAACGMYYVAGSGVGPRLYIAWSFSDPDGGAQTKYQVNVVNDNGSAFWDSGLVTSSDSYVVVPVDAVRGAFYKVTVYVQDTSYEAAQTAQRRCKAQWAVAEYRSNDLGAVTAWSTAAQSSAGANQAVVTEYASSSAGGAIASWLSSLSAAAIFGGGHNYFHWRVFLFAWSGAASPTFNNMALTYTSSTGVPPDGWTVTGQHALDTSTKVYGTQSLRCTCNNTALNAWQLIPVQKNTDYVLSGRVKSNGVSQARLMLSTGPTSGAIAQAPMVVATQDWTRMATPVWNSGDSDSVYVRAYADGAAPAMCWFDALKLEASKVVTAWTPGFVGAGVSIDAGGIKVDASSGAGATFRLQASNDTPRDVVELGQYGLRFGGDIELFSRMAGTLHVAEGNDLLVSGAQGGQGGGGTSGYWWKALTGVLPYQYAGFNGTGIAQMTGSMGQGRSARAIVAVDIYQGDVMGTQPSVSVRVNSSGEFWPGAFKVVVTSTTASSTTWELWIQSIWPYFTPTFRWISASGFAPQFLITPGTALALVAASSVGTAYPGTDWGSGIGGASFPGTPVNGQKFYNYTYNLEFFWHAGQNRWLSTELFTLHFGVSDALLPISAAVQTVGRAVLPPLYTYPQMYEVFVEGWAAMFNIAGGTALSGSHFWRIQLNDNAGHGLNFYDVNSGALSAWRNTTRVNVSSLSSAGLGAGSAATYFDISVTKTGTPGAIYIAAAMTYRMAAQ